MAHPYPLAGLSTAPGRAAFSITIVSLFLVTTTLILRVWAKTVSRRAFKTYDYLYFTGYAFAVAYSASFLYGIYPGVMGMHIEDAMRLYPNRMKKAFKIIAASTFVWAFATTLVKLSLLSYYLGIFKTRVFHIMAYIIAVLSLMLALAGILIGSLLCRPFAYNWDQSIAGGHCGDTLKMQLSTGAVNLILDFLIVLLPLPILWNLQMPWKKKAMLSCIFSLGLFICAMNITRITIAANQDQNDTTYSIAQIGLFSILEVNVGMICAALPTLGPLFFKERRRQTRSSGKMNTFVRLRTAAMGKGSGSHPSDMTASTADEDGLPLREMALGGRETRGEERDINVRTDIYVT